jgi:tryptophanyl-tRNA synthetase
MGWGHAKQELFERMDETLSPFRERYNELMKNPDFIHKILKEGSEKAIPLAEKKIKDLRQIIGID